MTDEAHRNKSALIDRYEREAWDDRFKPTDERKNSRAKHIGDAVFDALMGVAAKIEGNSSPELWQLSGGLAGSTAQAEARFWTQENREEILNEGRQWIGWAQQFCESPIEKHLLPWLVFSNWMFWLHKPIPVSDAVDDQMPVYLTLQARVAGYRLDFLASRYRNGEWHRVAIECDGAEFHGALRDRKRDKDLLKEGILTIRASGREIYDRPYLVAARVEEAFYKLEG